MKSILKKFLCVLIIDCSISVTFSELSLVRFLMRSLLESMRFWRLLLGVSPVRWIRKATAKVSGTTIRYPSPVTVTVPFRGNEGYGCDCEGC